jgi:WD40 repeat protein
MGHAYGIGFRIYDFPSLRMIFELDFENWKDVWSRLWALYRGAERYQARPDGSYPYEFIQDLWTVNDRMSFDPDGGTLLFGTMDGQVVGVDLADVSKPSGVWTVDDGPVLALDVSERHAMLATARFDGRIKLWQLDGSAARAADGAKPITETFCKMYKPVESTAPQSEFRTTDGKRWYNLDAMGDEELDEDAPP